MHQKTEIQIDSLVGFFPLKYFFEQTTDIMSARDLGVHQIL